MGVSLSSGYNQSGHSFEWNEKFLSNASLETHLRQLAISTHLGLSDIRFPDKFLSSGMSFPALESLFIHGLNFHKNPEFPHFPRLRYLTFCNLSFRDVPVDTRRLEILSTDFPSLEELRLLSVGTTVTVDQACLEGLKRLDLSGDDALAFLRDENKPSHLDYIKHIRIDPAGDDADPAIFLKFPRYLERLDLIVYFPFIPIEAPDPQILHDFHARFMIATENCEALRVLNIYCVSHGTEDLTTFNEAMNAIKGCCEAKGVRCHLKNSKDSWVNIPLAYQLDDPEGSMRYFQSVFPNLCVQCLTY
ncbi:hypothetical protein NLI96_g5307 [Meripilus lineatus]|uniref:Uncharacterized protein n=1 Tax=Meripilus lineatus TaxID=2056292 RepID=A0AAD5YH18_9APHY|nr:hypothetical protein NLI96_g5307 [Physisporinus lineatus]